jgi:hypothetical protein
VLRILAHKRMNSESKIRLMYDSLIGLEPIRIF